MRKAIAATTARLKAYARERRIPIMFEALRGHQNHAPTSGPREPLAHCSNALATGREQAKNRKGASVHHDLAIDENLVLAISPVLRIDVDLQLSSQLRRHPDGV